jgi:acetylglutamate kinase
VVKLGGSTLGARDTSLRDIAEARKNGQAIVIVHGGGAEISAWLAREGIEARFVRGLRVTDSRSMEIVAAVLGGLVNKRLVAELSSLGAPAMGVSGADSMILQARRFDEELGYVGEIERVNPFPIEELLRLGYLPVVAPIAVEITAPGEALLLNTNADTAAGEIAVALGARQLIFLTDVPGVMDERKALLSRLDANEARLMVDSGVVAGGMVPKLQAALRAAGSGCVTRIVDGTAASELSRTLAGEERGTEIKP